MILDVDLHGSSTYLAVIYLMYVLNATGHVGLSHRTHSGVFWFQAC